MKKRRVWAGALMVVWLLAGSACAQEKREGREKISGELPAVIQEERNQGGFRGAVALPAQENETAALYAQPNSESAVLMAYYQGAPLEVIRPAVNGFWCVQAGNAQAGIMGYMRAEELAMGAERADAVAPQYMELRFNREAPIYAYCDENAQILGGCRTDQTYYAMGKNEEKWVQLYLPPVNHIWEETERAAVGFVRLETGMARGYWQEPALWTLQPGHGELSEEQARELALEALRRYGTEIFESDLMEWELSGREQRACLCVDAQGNRIWHVYLWHEGSENALYVTLTDSADTPFWHSMGYIWRDEKEEQNVGQVINEDLGNVSFTLYIYHMPQDRIGEIWRVRL